MRMLKKALIAYVNSMKAVWSAIAHPLSIVSKRKGTLKGYRIYGNSVQDGTPTPENPIEVQSVGELTTKNLLYSYRSNTRIGNTVTMNGSEMLLEGKCIETTANIGLNYSSAESILLEAGKTYTLSAHYISGEYINSPDSFYVGLRKSDNNWYQSLRGITHSNYKSTKSKTFTVEEDVLVSFGCVGRGEFSELRMGIQLEEGSLTDYEPYHKYKVPVTVRGKNLWDKENYIESSSSTTETSCMRAFNASDYPWLKDANVLTFSATTFLSENDTRTSPYQSIEVLYTDNTKQGFFGRGITRGTEERYNLSCTFKKEISQIKVRPIDFGSNSGGVRNAYVKDIQIEYGDTATPYEPYIEPQTHDIYLNEPLGKIGDYADCIDGEKSVVVPAIKVSKLKNYGWQKQSDLTASDGTTLYRYEYALTTKRQLMGEWSTKGDLFCTGLRNVAYGPSTANNSISERVNTSNTGLGNRLRILTAEYSTVEDMIAAFGEFDIYYILDDKYVSEEPIELPKLPQFNGTTIYEVQADITPSGMEVCYYE